ncbi:hypothetical protein [Paraburkholderia fungorum]|uniref:hypothetical protein n=1 Tax=Paraburkholderia fungorum TaxID=134537 RepID=UPI00115FEBB8|nr:hypothetical protein [Paraburkholderia fungorum]
MTTAFAWVGLYLFGIFVLHGEGSLFDASRTAENTFFIAWFALTVVASILGGYVGYASGEKPRES